MNIVRSANRRGFNLGTAGWFTVLKPNTWFPATRLPNALHHFSGESRAARSSAAETPAAYTKDATISLNGVRLSAHDRSPMRLAWAAGAAVAITSALLWWMIQKQ